MAMISILRGTRMCRAILQGSGLTLGMSMRVDNLLISET